MNEISLKDLFLLNLKDHPYVMQDISKSKKDLENIHQQFDQLVPDGDWEMVQGQLLEHMEKLLDVPLGSILVNSWNKLREIRMVIEQQKESGNKEPQTIKLFDHKISSKHQPELEVIMNQKTVQTFPFNIKLQLKISALELEIKEGIIEKIMTGQCAGDGAISYMGAKLHEQKFLKFSLPGKINLNPKESTEQHILDTGTTASTHQEVIKQPSKNWLFYMLSGLALLVAALLFLLIF